MKYVISAFLLLFSLTSFSKLIPSLNIGTYNIRNFATSKSSQRTDLRMLYDILEKADFQILAVQEIADAEGLTSFIEENFPSMRVALSKCGGRGGQKLGFIYDKTIVKLNSFTEEDSLSGNKECHKGLRPLVIGKFIFNNKTITLFNVHLKAGAKARAKDIRTKQIRLISRMLERLPSQNTIAVGDFNTVNFIDPMKDSFYFRNFIKDHFQETPKNMQKCSAYWRSSKGVYSPSKLDHILVSNNVKKHFTFSNYSALEHCQRQKCLITTYNDLDDSYRNVSDHCPLKMTLHLKGLK